MLQPGPTDLNEPRFEPPASVRERLARRTGRSAELTRQLGDYIKFLLARNAEFNLTGDRDPQEQWVRHVEDALVAAELIEERVARPQPGERLLDVGSGGGVPGLVFAMLWPRVEVTLMEATGKKAKFLTEAAAILGLKNVKVLNMRAEEAGMLPGHREQYEWVTCRALAELPILAEWTVPFCKWSGRVVAIKGENLAAELRASERAFRVLSVPMGPKIFPYRLANGRGCTLLVYKKVGITPSTYPRRTGVARKKPL